LAVRWLAGAPTIRQIDRGASTGLPADARSEDVTKFFEEYGRILDCRVMTGPSSTTYYDRSNGGSNQRGSGFGFVEFENSKARRQWPWSSDLNLCSLYTGCRGYCAQLQRKTIHGRQVRHVLTLVYRTCFDNVLLVLSWNSQRRANPAPMATTEEGPNCMIEEYLISAA